ncbi:metal-sensitive transcriptional regulator [Alkaliphilus sp. MSJ-5]|uniref:Metal-sensitive transcriptional regulator n=1 Tax=Alkaliphilus flagellatus TaxID=2841507 RepID=A0ABS6FZS7_9FIRM|nr:MULTISPECIES: metal-sensitive transcriptional regulator [Alkaliphilus]MBU5675757.1 metal-sensitive transcriptional regulator [Alkaliphilus flagellatus]QUH19421.1 metal-sensing transcriptional repressor [Alkaliphilus sp. B6464]
MENCCGVDKETKKPTENSIKAQKSVLDRLNRIEGQIRGIKNMIENNTYCDDVINQIEASRSALHSVQIILLESHIKNCVVDQLQYGDTDVIEEVLKTIKKLTK